MIVIAAELRDVHEPVHVEVVERHEVAAALGLSGDLAKQAANVDRISGGSMWANLHLLFWLSLLPFTTGWMGENHFERWPTVLYGANLLACAIAFTCSGLAMTTRFTKGDSTRETAMQLPVASITTSMSGKEINASASSPTWVRRRRRLRTPRRRAPCWR